MKTRTKKSTSSQQQQQPKAAIKLPTLPPSDSNPPHLFILPKAATPTARILSLPNPATSKPSRYLVCPSTGFYEFTRVAAPKRACRSWLLAPNHDGTEQASNVTAEDGEQEEGEGYVLQTPALLLATPVDPVFLLLPALVEDEAEPKRMFLSASDYVDRLTTRSPHLAQMVREDRVAGGKLDELLERRLGQICEEMEAGGEKLYQFSAQKLVALLVAKARKMVQGGLPSSMEEQFVRRALVVPVMGVKREDSKITDDTADAEAEPETTIGAAQDETPQQPDANTDALPPPDILHLLRLRTALNYLLSTYLPLTLRAAIETLLPKHVDFSSLQTHLSHLAQLKADAHALRSMSDNIGRKRGMDDEAEERAEAKKRKKEEEEARKKNMSRGVKALGKVNVSGMKKMSSFFTKKAA